MSKTTKLNIQFPYYSQILPLHLFFQKSSLDTSIVCVAIDKITGNTCGYFEHTSTKIKMLCHKQSFKIYINFLLWQGSHFYRWNNCCYWHLLNILKLIASSSVCWSIPNLALMPLVLTRCTKNSSWSTYVLSMNGSSYALHVTQPLLSVNSS